MKSILIVKTSAIGDVIASLDVLGYLRERFPKAHIDWVVERPGASLLTAHPWVDRVLVCDTKKWRKAPLAKETWASFRRFVRVLRQKRYDLVFDLQGNGKSALWTAMARAKEKVGYSLGCVAEKLNVLSTNRRFFLAKTLPVRTRYLGLVQRYFEDTAPFAASPISLSITPKEQKRLHLLLETTTAPRLMIAFGSRWKNKQLPVNTLLEVIARLDARLHPTFFFPGGNQQEQQFAEQLVNSSKTRGVVVSEMSLPFWPALMQKMDGIVTMDSAALHLSGLSATPTVSLFGPSKAQVYQPQNTRQCALQGGCPYGISFPHRCPKLRTCKTGGCMKHFSSQEITEKILEQMRGF